MAHIADAEGSILIEIRHDDTLKRLRQARKHAAVPCGRGFPSFQWRCGANWQHATLALARPFLGCTQNRGRTKHGGEENEPKFVTRSRLCILCRCLFVSLVRTAMTERTVEEPKPDTKRVVTTLSHCPLVSIPVQLLRLVTTFLSPDAVSELDCVSKALRPASITYFQRLTSFCSRSKRALPLALRYCVTSIWRTAICDWRLSGSPSC
jgi:hypothetical protein